MAVKKTDKRVKQKQRQTQRQSVVVNIGTKSKGRKRAPKRESREPVERPIQYPSTIHQVPVFSLPPQPIPPSIGQKLGAEPTPVQAQVPPPAQPTPAQPIVQPTEPIYEQAPIMSAPTQQTIVEAFSKVRAKPVPRKRPARVPEPIEEPVLGNESPIQPFEPPIQPFEFPIPRVHIFAVAPESIATQEEHQQEGDIHAVQTLSLEPSPVQVSITEKLYAKPTSIAELEKIAQKADDETVSGVASLAMLSLGETTQETPMWLSPPKTPKTPSPQPSPQPSPTFMQSLGAEDMSQMSSLTELSPEEMTLMSDLTGTQTGEVKSPPPKYATLNLNSDIEDLRAFIKKYIPANEILKTDLIGQKGAWASVKRYQKKHKLTYKPKPFFPEKSIEKPPMTDKSLVKSLMRL